MSGIRFLEESGLIYHYPSTPTITNILTNTSNQGAVVGNPGTLPTGWTKTFGAGLVMQVIGFGSHDPQTALPYIDVELSGTATGSATNRIEFQATNAITISPSTAYALSYYVGLTAGSTTHVSTGVIQWDEYSSGGTYETTVNAAIPNSALTATLVVHTLTGTTGASTGSMNPAFNVDTVAGAVAATFRIAGAQLQLGSSRTTFQSTPAVTPTHSAGGSITGGAIPVPPQAAAAGFNTLVFNDDFTTTTTIATASSSSTGFNWYWSPQGTNSASQYSVNTTYVPGVTDSYATAAGASTGVLILNTCNDSYSAGLVTVPQNATTTTTVGVWNTGYFEAYLYCAYTIPAGNGAYANGDPAWWMFDRRGLSNGLTSGSIIAECDIVEHYPVGAAGAETYCLQGLINWLTSSSSATATNEYSNAYPNNVNGAYTQGTPAAGWHKWGVLWQGNGTTGTVQFYLDGVLLSYPTITGTNPTGSQFILNQGGATATTGWTAMPAAFMYLLLGSSESGWPLMVDWVRVFQSP